MLLSTLPSYSSSLSAINICYTIISISLFTLNKCFFFSFGWSWWWNASHLQTLLPHCKTEWTPINPIGILSTSSHTLQYQQQNTSPILLKQNNSDILASLKFYIQKQKKTKESHASKGEKSETITPQVELSIAEERNKMLALMGVQHNVFVCSDGPAIVSLHTSFTDALPSLHSSTTMESVFTSL